MTGKVCEIFESIQGEGLYQGERHIFVRLGKCNLDCVFCDTDFSRTKDMTIDEVLIEIKKYKDIEVVSVTGGEPLVQIDFFRLLAAGIKKSGKKVYLETNGTLYREITLVLEVIDIISMDFKLPSVSKNRALWFEHSEFLKAAYSAGKDVFVKIVVGVNAEDNDILRAVDIIGGICKEIKVIIQPEHPYEAELKSRMVQISRMFNEAGIDVTIKEQLHKKLGVR